MKYIYYITILFAYLFCACSDDDKNIEEDKSVAPKFLYSNLANKITHVLLDQQISLVYNTKIVVADDMGIRVNGENVAFELNDRQLILKLNLVQNTTYTVEILEGAVQNTAKEFADAVSISFITVADVQRYEAEQGILSGNAIIESLLPLYSGSGYVNQKKGDITFKIIVPKSGLYKVSFRYSNGNKEKENDIEVNGKHVATLKFSATEDWKTLSINKIDLMSGENKIAVRKNWGWLNLDYIEIESASENISFDVSSTLITPNPTKEAIELYNFLKENLGEKIISGAMANYSTGIEEAQWMFNNTGKWPALAGFDYINYTRDWNSTDFTELAHNAKEWWGNNGLVTIMWHWRGSSRLTDGFYTKETSFDVSKISDKESDEYKKMIADIDIIASHLKELQEANIPVLWRPLHESSGKWFWWGAKGAAPCKELWKVMYDRLVTDHHLNNLIWVWTCDTSDDAEDWYPGDDYVDILGLDIYSGEDNHKSQYIAFDKVKEMFNGKKIITLSECGSIPSINAMFEYGRHMVLVYALERRLYTS